MKKRSELLAACLVLFVAVFVFTATAVQYEQAHAISCNCTYSCCGGEGVAGGIKSGSDCEPCDENSLPCCACACY